MKVLITSGATREPIDSVRFISNMSTGSTGSYIADFLSRNKIEVTLVAGIGSQRPNSKMRVIEYSSFQDLDSRLKGLLGSETFNTVIHAAAVSDFSPEQSFNHKLNSDQDELVLVLKRNFKIIKKIKEYSQNSLLTQVIAFKLTDSNDAEVRMNAISKLSLDPNIDFVIHNDLSEINSKSGHKFTIFQQIKRVNECQNKEELAENLLKIIRGINYDFDS